MDVQKFETKCTCTSGKLKNGVEIRAIVWKSNFPLGRVRLTLFLVQQFRQERTLKKINKVTLPSAKLRQFCRIQIPLQVK